MPRLASLCELQVCLLFLPDQGQQTGPADETWLVDCFWYCLQTEPCLDVFVLLATSCGMRDLSFPNQGLNLSPLQWKLRVSTTELPGECRVLGF